MNGDESVVRITLLGNQEAVPMELLATEPSRHKTGRELRRVSVSFAVPAEQSEEINRELSAARDGTAPLSGEGGSWKVLQSSYSYQDGATTHRFQAELQELEEPPVATAVEMFGLSLQPKRYREEADMRDGVLVASVLVFLEGDEDVKLEAVLREHRGGDYFPVVRHGVSDVPLRMRFGRCLWQNEGDGRLHLLWLVDDKGVAEDSNPWTQVHQPELGRSLRKAAALEDQVATLVKVLQGSGVLDEEQVAAIHESAHDSWARHERDFDRTMDIELYFD